MSVKTNNFFYFIRNIAWKLMLKDVLRFYFYLIILCLLGFFTLKAHIHKSFNAFIINSDSSIFDFENGSTPLATPDLMALENSYEFLGKLMWLVIMTLTCFGVFFSKSPKKLQHILMVVICIFISSLAFLETPIQAIYNFLVLLGFALVPWIFSIVWFEFKKNSQSKQSKTT